MDLSELLPNTVPIGFRRDGGTWSNNNNDDFHANQVMLEELENKQYAYITTYFYHFLHQMLHVMLKGVAFLSENIT